MMEPTWVDSSGQECEIEGSPHGPRDDELEFEHGCVPAQRVSIKVEEVVWYRGWAYTPMHGGKPTPRGRVVVIDSDTSEDVDSTTVLVAEDYDSGEVVLYDTEEWV